MIDSSPVNRFIRIAAVCSFLGALTTALLIFLPNPEAADFEARVALSQNTRYITKLWILFIHPQVNFIASLGIAVILYRKYPWQIILGTLFLGIWAYTEMAQQALLIDSLNQIWRPGYLNATETLDQQAYKTLILAANGLSDSKYFLVIYGFGLGSLFYGWAFIQEKPWGKWVGVALVFIGILSLASFARYYLGMAWLNGFANWSYSWIYPYLQPLVRIALGVWMWQSIPTLKPVN